MRALERLLIYEWETSDPNKGFNERGGNEWQIRYQMRKSEWKSYGPPWMYVPLLPMSWEPVALLDLMNDIERIVSYLEKAPLSGDRCDDIQRFIERLQRRINQEDPSV